MNLLLKTSTILMTFSLFQAHANWQFYGSVGAAFHKGENTFQSKFTRIAINAEDKKNINVTGFMSEFAVGVKTKLNPVILNGELFFNYNNAKKSYTFSNVRLENLTPIVQTPTIETDQRKAFGVRFLAQLPVLDSLNLLAGVDLLLTQFEIKFRTQSADAGNNTAYAGTKTVYNFGYAPTIGAEAKLNETFSLRGTYAYQIHKSITFNNLVQETNDLTATTYKATLKPRAHVLKANLIIHF